MDIPTSMLFVLLASLISSIGQLVIAVKSVDPKKLKDLQTEIKEYFSELEAARRSSDKKLLRQLEKRKKYMDSLQSEVSKATMKRSLLSMAFTLSIFAILYYMFKPGVDMAFISTYFITNQSRKVQGLDFILWYAVCSLFFTLIIRKIMKVEI